MSYRKHCAFSCFFLLVVALAGCAIGPAATGNFDRTLTVSGPIRLELQNTSGDVSITGGGDKKVHVHAEVHASGWGFDSPEKRVNDIVSNPPINQHGDTIRIGEEWRRIHNVRISYVIEVPRETEVDSTLVSGEQTIQNVRGPVKAQDVSGSIRAERIEKHVVLNAISGSIYADKIGDDLRASSTSGTVAVSNVKGDVRISAVSGTTQIVKPGGRVEASTTSGAVEVQGATSDVKARAVSGRVTVDGNPAATSYWDLNTVSGTVQLGVPSNANFHLSAEASSGEIKTDIPVVVEEKGKHSLRARVGNGGGRVEVHTASGQIRVRAS
jgi:Putative adhesin